MQTIEIGSYEHANELMSACAELCAAKALLVVMKMLLRNAAARDWRLGDVLNKEIHYKAICDDLESDIEGTIQNVKPVVDDYLSRRRGETAHV